MNLSSRRFFTFLPVLIVAHLIGQGCNPLVSRFAARAVEQAGDPTLRVDHKNSQPIRPDVGLSILWVGHATMLIQIHDKVIITDPVFSNTVGMLAKRTVEAGLDPAAITQLSAILISHIHFDHFNFGSLDLLPKDATLVVPAGGLAYTPEFGFRRTLAACAWKSFDLDGLRITPVPVQHFGGRYGFDAAWNSEPTWTGYIIEYRGTTILFTGDTAYNPELFKEIGRRFKIDIALLPIAPVEPRDFMKRVHADPAEALQIFHDVGAAMMIPMHYGTFFQGLEPTPDYAKSILQRLIADRGLEQRVRILGIGEQVVLKEH